MLASVSSSVSRLPLWLFGGIAVLLLAHLAAVIAVVRPPVIVATIDPSRISSDSGVGYVTPMRLGGRVFTVKSDSEEVLASRLRFFENQTELEPAHAPHDDIRRRGVGRFSHWRGDLFFSTSDNSDPRTNGRSYGVFVKTALNFDLLVALGVLDVLCLLALRAWVIRHFKNGIRIIAEKTERLRSRSYPVDSNEPHEAASAAYISRPSPLATAAVVAAAAFGLAWFCGLTYRTNDDVAMRAIAEGLSGGQSSEFIFFQNVLAGLVLRTLYAAAPQVPWYDAVLAAATAAGSVMFLLAALRLCKSQRETIFCAFLGLIVFTGTFRNLQFSAAATLLGAGGTALLISVAFRPPVARIRMWLCAATAAVAFFWGSLFRWDSAVLAIVLVAPLLMLGLRKPVLAWRAPVAGLVLGLLLLTAGKAVDVVYYQSTPGWETFQHDKERRLAVSEYLHADFSRATEMTAALDAVAWSRNDYELITGWMFAVPDIFSNDRVTRFAALAPRKSWTARAGDLFQKLAPDLPVIWLFVSLGVLAILMMRSLYSAAVMLVSAGGLLAVMITLSVVFKPSFLHILWVMCGTVSFAATTAAFAGTPHIRRRGYYFYEDRWIAGAVLAAIGGIALWQIGDMRANSNDADRIRAQLAQELAAWSLPPKTIVLAWDAHFPFERWVQPFRPYPRYDWRFFHVTHEAVSPLANSLYSQWGSSDVLWSLCHVPGTYLVESQFGYTRHERMLADYMREHHAESVTLVPVVEGEATLLLTCRPKVR